MIEKKKKTIVTLDIEALFKLVRDKYKLDELTSKYTFHVDKEDIYRSILNVTGDEIKE